MGKLEKIVVLTVLSLITVILAISFITSEDPMAALAGSGGLEETALSDQAALSNRERSAGSDGDGMPEPARIAGRAARERAASVPAPRDLDLSNPFERSAPTGEDGEAVDPGLEWPESDPAAPEEAAPSDAREELLLSSTVGGGALKPVASQAGLPEGAALVTSLGLEDTWDPELKQYVWRSGDSFLALAQRFYGDGDCAELLRLFNEGRERISPGEAILVPVFDHRGVAPERPTAGGTYVVQDGESLWTISKKQYGRGSDWQKLFEANRERLASPDDVRAGMELVIP